MSHRGGYVGNNGELSPVLNEQLQTILDRYEHLQAILVSTAEGVPLLKVTSTKPTISYEYAETVLPTVFAGAAEQIGKLRFHTVKSITAFYGDIVLIHINDLPLVTTLVATNSAQIGALLALSNSLCEALEPFKKCVETADVHS